MNNDEDHIAIIGMACRFPGAEDVNTFWKNICEGVESISFYSEQDVLSSHVEQGLLNNPDYVKAGGVLKNVENFDASLFAFSPREAGLTDPQQRLLLECGWEALEHAGYDPRGYDGLIGVFAGTRSSSYLLNNLVPSQYWLDGDDRDESQFANYIGFVSALLSYKLQLKGASVTVQTACSTSLVAVHMACQSLLNYECDMALAGGASVQVPQHGGYLYQPEGILSPDGHCRVFDSKAAGTVFSNGAGLVVLKRLQDALNDGDCIDAVLIGSALNNDGGGKPAFTAPSAQGQANVVAMAQAMAGVEPGDVRFVEAHGTGTLLGDPIEVSALKKIFDIDRTEHCALGSVKANIGHLDAAAGIAGLMKAALTVKNGVIPPCINYDNPNPALELENSPFFINNERINWPGNGGARIAGVSSFGMGGTNAHAIVMQPPELGDRQEAEGPSLVVLSAESEHALQQIATRLGQYLQEQGDVDIKDLAYTLQLGRVPLTYRRAIVCQNRQDLLDKLGGEASSDNIGGRVERPVPSVVFMFPGQGSQYVNMGRDLYEKVDVFRRVFDQCASLLQPFLSRDIRTLLYVTPGEDEAAQSLSQTEITQPLLFAFEYALAKTWMEWGIVPVAFIGHSIGEYVAAALAGVMSLEDALSLVAERGRLIQSLPGGAMLAVSLAEEKVGRWLSDDVALAAVNAPESCVLSGEGAAIDKLAMDLQAHGVDYQKLHTSHAFHSYMLDPVLETFRDRLERVSLSKPRIPFVSNVTGEWIAEGDATTADYWVRHIRQGVRFSDGIQCLMKTHKGVLLEVGPGNTLATLSRKHSQSANLKIAASLKHPLETIPDDTYIYRTLAALWVEGVDVKWASLPGARRCRRIHLPTYPFERKRYWVDPSSPAGFAQTYQLTGKQADIENWFYRPGWQRTPFVQTRALPSKSGKTWVIFAYPGSVAEALVAELATHGDAVITVFTGSEFRRAENEWTIDPSEKQHYERLLSEIDSDLLQLQFVYALSLTAPSCQASEHALINSCTGILYLSQAIANQQQLTDVVLNILTKGVEDVTGDENIDPVCAISAGIARVNGQEYPNCFTRHMDVSIEDVAQAGTALVSALANDLHEDIDARSVAYRNQQRWQPELQRLDLRSCTPTMLRRQGVYLITGGLGNIGLTIAEYLAERASAHLILLSRSALPPKDDWDAIIASNDDSMLGKRLRTIRNIEQTGAIVHAVNADVANVNDMTRIMEFVNEEFGVLNGVIHAAGVLRESSFRPVADIEPLDIEKQFTPKVHGVRVLKQVLGDTHLDFCMLVSSLSVQLGGLGSAVYSSANRFMDAYALKMHRDGYPWFSVNWDTWQFDPEPAAGNKAAEGALQTYNLTADEGKRVLDKVFGVGDSLPVLCVSTGDLIARYEQTVLLAGQSDQRGEPDHSSHAQQTLPQGARNDPPRNEIEKVLAGIWQDLLGLDYVGIKDNFFELGGDSLKGLRLTSRIRQQLDIELSVNELFKAPTVMELASSIPARNKTTDNVSSQASELREKVDRMSPEQITALLEKMRRA